MMDDASDLTITFRCPPELEAVLPRPIPAVQGLPDWFKAMPQKAYSALLQAEQMTLKKCLPFQTLTRLVDADRYRDNFINFPAYWRDLSFNGVLPKGTPVAQCLPLKRDTWAAQFETIDAAAAARLQELSVAVTQEQGIYRRQFRAPKR